MNKELIERIRNNQNTYNYLRENSYLYKELIRDNNKIIDIEKLAKNRYKESLLSKINKISNNIKTIKTIIDVMD